MDIYTKFDLHIHSVASAKTKSGDKVIVNKSTIVNLPELVQKLEDNMVNLVAITDHNIFDKDIYIELKKQEKISNSIQKVLPGVEIDLNINSKLVHVVCVFDDSDINHINKIENGFTAKSSYTVDELGSILRKIDLSTVLIAHQKCDYITERQQKTSLSCAGKEEFYKFIGCEFFDALEIQNTKVEGILKSRFSTDNISDVNLIVGSDCHEWSAYPAHHNGRAKSELMYIKSLPTFEGLIMAVTDNSRIYKYVPQKKVNALNNIELEVREEKMSIPLSDNINVIIGDNSVGKSSIVKYLSGMAEIGMIDFLKNHGVKILTNPLHKENFSFSGQGKIREMFESSKEKLPIKEKFKDQFIPIDIKKYQDILKNILMYYFYVWERNDNINTNINLLKKSLYIPIFTEKDKHYLSIKNNINYIKNEYKNIVEIFNQFYEKFTEFNKYRSLLNEEDIKALRTIRSNFIDIGKKYKDNSNNIDFSNEIKAVFECAGQIYSENILKLSNSDESMLSTYREECQKAVNNICDALEYKFSYKESIWNNFIPFKINQSTNSKGKYCFITKPIREVEITSDLIIKYIKQFIEVNKPIDELTTTEILNSIKGKRINDKINLNLKQFIYVIYNKFDEEYFSTTVEIKRGSDKLQESNSAGINALYFIDILSNTYNRPIFIIDQPEDDVSQSRIASNLILSLKNLSKRTQIILVTHNPQLVVNLDVDNVIVLKKEENGINFYSGCLEYKNNEFSILGLVADTLDGGADVIKKRWKRYGKTNI